MGVSSVLILSLCLYATGVYSISIYIGRNNVENYGMAACKKHCFDYFPSNPGAHSPFESGETKGSLVTSCRRGCRFYSIVEVLNKSADRNQSLSSCIDNCNDAYPVLDFERAACRHGCATQYKHAPVKETVQQSQASDERISDPSMLSGVMYPIMTMRRMYSSLSQHVSLAFLTVHDTDGHTGVVVVKSQPAMIRYWSDEGGKPTAGEKSSTASSDLSRPLQVKSYDMFGNEVNTAQMTSDLGDQPAGGDWLTCLAQRTGIPRLLVCLLLLLSAVALLWLAVSAAHTAPSTRVKLSINSGDLEYLRKLPEKRGIKAEFPQVTVPARPLLTKLHMEKL